MGRVESKCRALCFLLFISKWTKINDLEEIKQRSNKPNSASTILANAELSNSNRPKVLPKASALSLVQNLEDKLSDSEFVTSSEADYNLDDKKTDPFSEVLTMDVDQNWKQQKKDLKVS